MRIATELTSQLRYCNLFSVIRTKTKEYRSSVCFYLANYQLFYFCVICIYCILSFIVLFVYIVYICDFDCCLVFYIVQFSQLAARVVINDLLTYLSVMNWTLHTSENC